MVSDVGRHFPPPLTLTFRMSNPSLPEVGHSLLELSERVSQGFVRAVFKNREIEPPEWAELPELPEWPGLPESLGIDLGVIETPTVVNAQQGSLVVTVDLTEIGMAVGAFLNSSPVAVVASWLTIGEWFWRYCVSPFGRVTAFRIRIGRRGRFKRNKRTSVEISADDWPGTFVDQVLASEVAREADSMEIVALRTEGTQTVLVTIRRSP